MKYGPDDERGLSWNAVTEDDSKDAICIHFLGVFEDLPKQAKQEIMEGALEALNKFFGKKTANLQFSTLGVAQNIVKRVADNICGLDGGAVFDKNDAYLDLQRVVAMLETVMEAKS